MAFNTNAYNARNIDCTFGPVALTSGFSEGGKVTINMLEDAYSMSVGTAGESTVSVMNNESAEMIIPLKVTSSAHKEMVTLYTASKLAPSGVIFLPFACIDRVRGLKYFAPEAFIVKLPDAEYGQEAGDREWTLNTGCMLVSPL